MAASRPGLSSTSTAALRLKRRGTAGAAAKPSYGSAFLKRLLEQFEGRRAPPVGVIEVVTGERLAPRLQQACEAAIGNRRRHQVLEDVEDAEGCASDHNVGIIWETSPILVAKYGLL
jgi:hypothetical protein